MADITMCKGVMISQKEMQPQCLDCYRRTATPTPERQSYFTDAPLSVVKNSTTCQYYWKETK